MVVIGLTGGVGTGKSTVAGMLKRRGAVVLDADRIAHDAIRPGRPAWRDVVRAFGPAVLRADRTVNRRCLAAVVFADPAKRRRLERIIHPRVMRTIRGELARLRRGGRTQAVVLDVPLLVEVGARRLADALVVVTASKATQRRRLAKKHGWSRREVDARSKAQWDLAAKVALADHVVDNSGSVQRTRTQVERLWNQLAAPSKRSSTSRR